MLKNISWRNLVRNFRKLGYDGPFSGGRHFFMIKSAFKIHIPNPHRGDISKALLRKYCVKPMLRLMSGTTYNLSNKRKRVLIFSLAYIPFVSGAELAVKEITDRINDLDFDLITLRFDRKWAKKEKIGNVNIYRIGGGKLFFPFFAFWKARNLHKKNGYDSFWSIMANRAGFATLFFKLWHPKVKYLLALQEGDTLDYPEKRMGLAKIFIGGLFRKIFTKADHIQAISNYLADWARNMDAKASIEIVPNGISVEKFIKSKRSEERRVGKECRSRWSPYH